MVQHWRVAAPTNARGGRLRSAGSQARFQALEAREVRSGQVRHPLCEVRQVPAELLKVRGETLQSLNEAGPVMNR